jgi:hypothetical protein
MSTVEGGGNIVTDGLVLYLDAANTKSYVSGSTTWRDLSRSGYNGTLVNSPSFSSANGGSIVFDGSNDYISTTYNGALTDFTACIWYKSDLTNPQAARLVDKSYLNGFWMGKALTGAANSWGGGVREGSAPYGRFITLPDAQWHFLVSRRSGTTHTIFGDGITNTVSGTVSSTVLSTDNMRLGAEYNIVQSLFKGNIAQVQMYNRALSAAEILQNYNATKSRYI